MTEVMIIQKDNPVFHQQVLEANKRGYFLGFERDRNGDVVLADIYILLQVPNDQL